MNQGFVSLT